MPTNARWTAEEDELLTKLADDGDYSCSQMAVHFPRHPSRNAIIGRMHRLGLIRDRQPREKGTMPIKPTRVQNRLRQGQKKAKSPPMQPDVVLLVMVLLMMSWFSYE